MSFAIRLPLAAAALVAAGATAWTLAPHGAAELPPMAAAAQDAEAAQAPEVAPMVLGAEDAPVTMIEYASYTCPHCATFHDEVWPAIERDYVDEGLVRFEYREVYFDRAGLWASMVARCGGEERFFGITDLLYENQATWSRGEPAAVADALRRVGLTAGLTTEEIAACMTDADKAQALVETFEANAEADGIRSTPSFLIDGELHGNMSEADLRALLDERLAEAGEG
jgi:protein-disulfide isomerase